MSTRFRSSVSPLPMDVYIPTISRRAPPSEPVELQQPEPSKHTDPYREGTTDPPRFHSRFQRFLFMSADYSQIELRIAAAFSKDQTMIEAFRSKRDIHTTTAAKVFKVALDKVTPDMRRKAKGKLGILYGTYSIRSRAKPADLENGSNRHHRLAHFKDFPGIKRYMRR